MKQRTRDVGARLGSVQGPGTSAELWYACVGDHVNEVERFSREFLSDVESARVHEYRSPGSAERYVVTRSLVRLVLGAHLNRAPRDVPVSRTDTGKPVIAGGVHFNVSHSGELILLGLCEDRPIGVDVERKRDVQRVDLMVARWLDEAERQQFDSLTSRGLTTSDAFLRVWSLKEARLKALGVGIAGSAGAPLDTVVVRALDELLDDLALDGVDAGYVGAVAFA